MAKPRRKMRRIRKQRGIAVSDAAQCLGVSKDAWYMWELGKRTPQVDMAIRIARLLGVSVEDIFADDTSRDKVS